MQKWNNLKINEVELFVKSAEKTSGLVVQLNKQQLTSGIDSTGKRLPGYSKRHKRFREKKGLQTSVKDLNLEGGHYAGIYAKHDNEGIEIASNDWKSEILESDWGKIYGLTPENLDKYIAVFGEVFLDELKIKIRAL